MILGPWCMRAWDGPRMRDTHAQCVRLGIYATSTINIQIWEYISLAQCVLISPNCSRHSITFCLLYCLARSSGVLPSCMCVCVNKNSRCWLWQMHTCSGVFNVCRLYSFNHLTTSVAISCNPADGYMKIQQLCLMYVSIHEILACCT